MFGMETIPEVYFIWIQSRLYEAGVEMTTDHFVEQIDGSQVRLLNVYQPDRKLDVDADWIVMATGRHSENCALPRAARAGRERRDDRRRDRPARDVRSGVRGPPRRAQALAVREPD